MEQHFGNDHPGFPQLCHDLAQHRNFDWLLWRGEQTLEPPLTLYEKLHFAAAIPVLRQQFDTIFKPCVVVIPDVHPSILALMVNMLHDIPVDPPPVLDMYDGLIKSVKLPNWKEFANESTLQFLGKYSTLPPGTMVQVTALASVMDLRYLAAILMVLFVKRVDLWDTERLVAVFAIEPANSESATVKLKDILDKKKI